MLNNHRSYRALANTAIEVLTPKKVAGRCIRSPEYFRDMLEWERKETQGPRCQNSQVHVASCYQKDHVKPWICVPGVKEAVDPTELLRIGAGGAVKQQARSLGVSEEAQISRRECWVFTCDLVRISTFKDWGRLLEFSPS